MPHPSSCALARMTTSEGAPHLLASSVQQLAPHPSRPDHNRTPGHRRGQAASTYSSSCLRWGLVHVFQLVVVVIVVVFVVVVIVVVCDSTDGTIVSARPGVAQQCAGLGRGQAGGRGALRGGRE